MSDSPAGLLRKIGSAGDLRTVVRTMKTLAASNIGQFERAVVALVDYYRTVELGLSICFRKHGSILLTDTPEVCREDNAVGVIVFGSDQGLVGQFNEILTEYVTKKISAMSVEANVWAVGERIFTRLSDAGIAPQGQFPVPNSVAAISTLIGQIQVESDAYRSGEKHSHFFVFHNRPQSGAQFEPVCQRLLPLDGEWQRGLAAITWPTKKLPEVLGGAQAALPLLVREYLFISLFRACAESLASENASRLASMQRAEKNIDELLTDLNQRSHHLRQSSIDEELFDVISGFEALAKPGR